MKNCAKVFVCKKISINYVFATNSFILSILRIICEKSRVEKYDEPSERLIPTQILLIADFSTIFGMFYGKFEELSKS